MKQISLILAIVAAAAVCSLGQSNGKRSDNSGKTEKDLLRLEHELIDAFAKQDRAFLERVMSDDYVSNNADGSVTNKAQSIAAAEAGFFAGTSSTGSDVKVRIYGDTAVITSLDTVKGKFNGQFRHTSVWVRRNGHWQAVSWQGTPVPPK